jgi:hypothetical protein
MARALFHAKFDIVRRSRGQSAVKISAYQLCGSLTDANGRKYDFSRKAEEHRGHAVLLPDGAPAWAANPGELWRQAEQAEKRVDGQTARLLELSIPRQIPAELRMEFARHVFEPFRANGMAVQLDLHAVRGSDSQENGHIHAEVTLRPFERGDFAEKKNRKWNAAFMDQRGRRMRAMLAARINAFCREKSIDCYVDHRSHRELGLDIEPEQDVPRTAWAAYKRDPENPPECVREVLERRELLRQLRSATAAAHAADEESQEAYRLLAGQPDAWERLQTAFKAERDAAFKANRDAAGAAFKAQQARHKQGWAALRARHSTERDRVFRRLRRGLLRELALVGLRARHAAERRELKIEQSAERAAPLATQRREVPTWTEWLTARAAQGDKDAVELIRRAEGRDARLPPRVVADRNITDALRRIDAGMKVERPRGETSEHSLFQTARERLDTRLSKAADAATAARAAANEEWHRLGFFQRLVRQERWGRLESVARATERELQKLKGSYRDELDIAKVAAKRAADKNTAARQAWERSPAAMATERRREVLRNVAAAIRAGDAATIQAAATGDLDAASKAAEERRQRERDQHTATDVAVAPRP